MKVLEGQKDNFNCPQEKNSQDSHVGKPANKDEQIRLINDKFNDVLLGITPKGCLLMNIAMPTRDFCTNCGFDEVTTLKLMVINYHDTLSSIMTDKYCEKEPFNLADDLQRI